ncbi:hypothetical protein [Salipiger mangrovisoli]|uniref:hypothetical protein n=1 Tax=Salipiger mangrovisoli TaxID=2865933 RepID=UPI001882DE0C|nr:hypothetical protein [Salipiger mangrovisoli]
MAVGTLREGDLGDETGTAGHSSAVPPTEEVQLPARRTPEQQRELRLTGERLHQVTERREASVKALRASNEELLAVPEELLAISSGHEGQIERFSELDRSTGLVPEPAMLASPRRTGTAASCASAGSLPANSAGSA